MTDGAPTPDLARSSTATSPRDRTGGGSDGEAAGVPSTGGPLVRTSTVLAAAVGSLATFLVGAAATTPLQAGALTVAGLGLAGGTTLLVGRDPVRAAGGTALSVLSACAVVAAVAAGRPVAMAALGLAAFAAPAIPLGSIGDDGVTEAAGTLVYALVPVGAFAALAVAARLLEAAVEASAAVTAPADAGASLTGFAVLLLAAAGACLFALSSLPVVRLAHKRDRDRVRAGYRDLRSRLKRATVLAAASIPVSVLVWGVAEASPGVRSAVAPLAAVTGAAPLRVGLLVVAVLGAVVGVSVRVVRWAGGGVVDLTRRGTAAAVGVGVSVLAIPLAGPLYEAATASLGARTVGLLQEFGNSIGPVATVLLAALVAVTVLVIALLALPAVVGLGLAPDRTAAPAFAAAGVLAGSALAVDAVPGYLTLGGVVAAMVVWDLGEYGVGVVEEVGDAAATRAESVHAAGTLGVGVLVGAGAVAVHALVAGVSIRGTAALAGLTVAFVGVVLLAAVLRG
jgi:hypothetical protein